MALFKTEPSELGWLQVYNIDEKIVVRTGASLTKGALLVKLCHILKEARTN